LTIFQLLAAKSLKVLAHYAKKGKEVLSPFIDSSIDTDQSRLYQSFLDFAKIPKLHLLDTLLQDLRLGPTN